MMPDRFTPLAPELMTRRLQLPTGKSRVVIDTDTANEIDDQYALAWALLSPESMSVEAITAEPFSFAHHRAELLAAEQAILSGAVHDEHLVGGFQGWISRLHAQGRSAKDVKFVGPAEGMELSYLEILNVCDKLGVKGGPDVHRGAESYLTSLDEPIKSASTEAIIDLAKSGEGPLYIAAMGCLTNVASALLLAPEITHDIVVLWTAGFPTSAPHTNRPSLNLVQDVLAARLLFDCGVPHIYLPGYHVGAQLKISLPEMERFVRGQGAIGDYLHYLYTHNPLHEMFAIENAEQRTWVIWDIIDIAWLINPNWVPTHMTTSPVLDENLFWKPNPQRHAMREAHDVQRDEIFCDFYAKLAAARQNPPVSGTIATG